MGRPVRYDATAKPVTDDPFERWRAEGRLVSVCPEVSGGLPVPRPPAELAPAGPFLALTPVGRDAAGHTQADATATSDSPLVPKTTPTREGRTGDRPAAANTVVSGQEPTVPAPEARIVTDTGEDVTDEFMRGARIALETARRAGIRIAILKESSPSCGSHRVYDGTFSGTQVPGTGVTAALLTSAGIGVFSEEELPEAAAYLAELES